MSSLPNNEPPPPWKVLAALCKFSVISRAAPDYYDRHRSPVDRAFAGLRAIAVYAEPLQIAFARSLPLDLEQGAQLIVQALKDSNLSEEILRWIADEIANIAIALRPVVDDAELPAWLAASGDVIRSYLAEHVEDA